MYSVVPEVWKRAFMVGGRDSACRIPYFCTAVRNSGCRMKSAFVRLLIIVKVGGSSAN